MSRRLGFQFRPPSSTSPVRLTSNPSLKYEHLDLDMACLVIEPSFTRIVIASCYRVLGRSSLLSQSCQTILPSFAPRLKPHLPTQFAIAPGLTNPRFLPPSPQVPPDAQSTTIHQMSYETQKLDSQMATRQQRPPLNRMPLTLQQFQLVPVDPRSFHLNLCLILPPQP
jgi:hypothetical protein